jgi:hypothetical protein
MLLLLEMKVVRRTTNTSASAFVAKGLVPPPPASGLPPPSMSGEQQWRANPHHRGYGKNKGKNKVYKPAAAPPAPTPYNSCTGAIQMWPMPQPAGHGILGPRPGPRANAFMASPHASHASSYGTATYGAPLGVGHGAPAGAWVTAPEDLCVVNDQPFGNPKRKV